MLERENPKTRTEKAHSQPNIGQRHSLVVLKEEEAREKQIHTEHLLSNGIR